MLVPLGLMGAGVWQLFKKGLLLDSVPGWLLVWFGFDAFIELHPGVSVPLHRRRDAQASEN